LKIVLLGTLFSIIQPVWPVEQPGLYFLSVCQVMVCDVLLCGHTGLARESHTLDQYDPELACGQAKLHKGKPNTASETGSNDKRE
jgi:hypothetical protein